MVEAPDISPANIAKNTIAGPNYTPAGFLTTFKQTIVKFCLTSRGEILDDRVSDLANQLAFKPNVIYNWINIFKDGGLITTINDKMFLSGITRLARLITHEEFLDAVKQACAKYAVVNAHSTSLHNFYCAHICADTRLYTDFVVADNNLLFCPGLVELEIQSLLTSEEYQEEIKRICAPEDTTPMEDLSYLYKCVDNLEVLTSMLRKEAWSSNPALTTIYKFEAKPNTPYELLLAISRAQMPEVPNIAERISAVLGLDTDYVYPHFKAGVIPEQIQDRVFKQLIKFIYPNTYILVSLPVLEFITSVPNWDWSMLFLKDSLLSVVDVSEHIDFVESTNYNTKDGVLFGRELDNSQYWSMYPPKTYAIPESKPITEYSTSLKYVPGQGINIKPGEHREQYNHPDDDLEDLTIFKGISREQVTVGVMKYESTYSEKTNIARFERLLANIGVYPGRINISITSNNIIFKGLAIKKLNKRQYGRFKQFQILGSHIPNINGVTIRDFSFTMPKTEVICLAHTTVTAKNENGTETQTSYLMVSNSDGFTELDTSYRWVEA